MCRALYIASSNPLPLIEWDEENPGFYVTELRADEEIVRKQVTLPFVAYAGSFEGCSCGFAFDDEPIEDDDEKQYDTQARESVKKLREYISGLLNDGPVEMFTSWEGEQSNEPEDKIAVGLDFFDREEFGLEGIKHFTIVN